VRQQCEGRGTPSARGGNRPTACRPDHVLLTGLLLMVLRSPPPPELGIARRLGIGRAAVLFAATINEAGGQLNELSPFLSIEVVPEVP
jgi:hypothetical protein